MVRAAQALVLALVLIALVRAATLELDPYDAYEVRSSARATGGDRTAPFMPYRSALLTLAEAPLERWARGSAATWVFPHLLTALAYGGLACAAVALARAAGASREASWAAGVAVALDRLAFADAPLGLPDALAAALGAIGLAQGLRALEEPSWKRLLSAGTLLGLGAAARPNAGLACGALLVVALALELRRPQRFLREKSPLAAGLVLGINAVGIYFLVVTLFFGLGKGSLTEGLQNHAELARFQREQFAENARKYGSLFPPFAVYSRAAFFMEPATTLLAPFAIALALTRGNRRHAVLGLASLAQVVFLVALVGHGEARYLLPALIPLAALGALALDSLAARLAPRLVDERSRRNARVLVAVAWVGLPLALGARFEADRASDPVLRENFSERVAAEVARVSSDTAMVYWTPDLPFPVYPRALARDGTPFRGDPFHGIFHAGPVTVGYHLGRPIHFLLGVRVSTLRDLEALARASPRALRPGDVFLLGVARPGLSWQLPQESPAIQILRVREPGTEPPIEVVGRVGF